MNDAKFEQLAERVLDDALKSEEEQFALDAFKVLSTYRIATAKLSAKLPDDNPDEGMSGMRRRIAAASEGK